MTKQLRGMAKRELSLARDLLICISEDQSYEKCAGSPEFSPYLPDRCQLTCVRSIVSEQHFCLAVFLQIRHVANSRKLNDLRIENSCLPEFHR